MKRKIIVNSIFALGVVVALTSCNRDEVGTEPEFVPTTIVRTLNDSGIEDEDGVSLSKSWPTRKSSYVYYNYGDPYDPSIWDCYQTVRIKDAQKMFHQEWLIEDFRDTLSFVEYVKRPDDPDGKKYGVYYKWGLDWRGLELDDFNYMFMEKDGTALAKGFHIPTETDFEILRKICGKDNDKRMGTFLNVGFDGIYDCSISTLGFDDLPTAGVFWFDAQRSGYNPHPTCGAYAHFSYPSYSFQFHYPNGPYVYANVRFVRNLSPNEN